jgi:hypothetical protein
MIPPSIFIKSEDENCNVCQNVEEPSAFYMMYA